MTKTTHSPTDRPRAPWVRAALALALPVACARPPAARDARPAVALAVAQRAEVLDTLVREAMLVEHPSGVLFVAGYNRVRPGLWKSADRGATWARVDVGSAADGAIGNSDVALAVAPDGTTYFASMGFDRPRGEGTHVAVGVSRDVGATWRWSMVSRARFDDRPWIVVAPNGSAHVVWNDGGGVQHAVSRDRGITWTRLPRVTERGGSSHLAVGPRGELAVRVGPGNASGNKCDEGVDLVVVSLDDGATWHAHPAPGGPLPSGCTDEPRRIPRWVDPVAWDAGGALYALSTDTAHVWLARSTDAGATWTRWPIAATEAPTYYPYLAARHAGELSATWVTAGGDALRWTAARIRVPRAGVPNVARTAPLPLESWAGQPPGPDAGGEYLATAILADGSMAVVTPVQHETAGRLGFTWWRFVER